MKILIPASRKLLGWRWANIITYVGTTSANDVGPMCLYPSVQHWHNIVTPPTMTLCQRFANVITYCILLYLMVGATLAQCIMNGLLSIGITSLSPIACRRLRDAELSGRLCCRRSVANVCAMLGVRPWPWWLMPTLWWYRPTSHC